MKVSFISEFETIGYGRTLSVNRLMQKLEEKGITVSKNNDFKKADIIHAHSPLHITLFALNKYKDKKFVGTIHANPDDFKNAYVPFDLSTELSWKFYEFVYSKFDKLVAPTKYIEHTMKEKGFENITTISNGVDLDVMKPNKELAEKFEDKFGFKDFIFVVGRLNDPRKDIETAIELAKNIDYEFVHAGEILPIFATSFVQRAIKKLKAPKNFHFLGYLSQEEMIGAYNSAKLLLQCSKFETEGLVVLEAMGCGTPIIARNLPVYNGLLKNKENSFLCKNEQELKNKIIELLNNSKLQKKFSQNGLKDIKRRSLDKSAEKYISLYETLLNEKA